MTLFVALSLLFVVSDLSLRVEPAMPTTPTTAERAAAEMKAKRYAEAADLWRQAAAEKGDPELCLGRLAECLYYLKRYDAALVVCDEVEEATTGESQAAPYIRGLIAVEKKEAQVAASHFNVAFMRRHPLARHQLETLRK